MLIFIFTQRGEPSKCTISDCIISTYILLFVTTSTASRTRTIQIIQSRIQHVACRYTILTVSAYVLNKTLYKVTSLPAVNYVAKLQ